MATREVVKVFQGGVDESYYEVEYEDSNGDWISAAGGWDGGVPVKGMYSTPEAAVLTAQALHRTHGHRTRAVRVKA